MYGSTVSKDLNLPAVQPQMSSPGLLRYRSAPSNLLGEVCAEDFHAAEGGAGHHQRPDHAADAALARFLAGHHHAEIGDCKPPRPAAAAHILDDDASMAAQHPQQQIMYHQQQQQVAAMDGFYRTLSSNGTEHAVGSGNNLVRQSSSPAGFIKHLNMDNGNWRFLLCTTIKPIMSCHLPFHFRN